MWNPYRLKEILADYKKELVRLQWLDGKYKWEAVKDFQEHWDINEQDFSRMLTRSLSKTGNLLDAGNRFPAKRIIRLAELDPEEVRSMYRELFGEDQDLIKRINNFQVRFGMLMERYKNRSEQHFQDLYTISTYLWLRYPDQYYSLNCDEIKIAAKILESDDCIEKEATADAVWNLLRFYQELCKELKLDQELIDLIKGQMTPACYPDPNLHILAVDVVSYISRFVQTGRKESEAGEWQPADNSPNITVEEWIALLQKREIFHTGSLEIMKRILDYGGKATCTQLSIKYGETKSFYYSGSCSLAKRIADSIGCPVISWEQDSPCWWPILYQGREIGEEKDSYIWKLREELKEALKKTDLSEVRLYANSIPAIWKISHGRDCISDSEAQIFESRQAVVVHKDTKAKAQSRVTQGESFMLSMKKGDYFYLCRGNSIRLLGQIDSDEAVLNPEKKNGWYQRSYTVIAESKNFTPYKGPQKWWTPNDNSTCIAVSKAQQPLFEQYILQPYFGLIIAELFQGDAVTSNYWWLNANPKIWSFSDIGVGEVQAYTMYNDSGNKRRIFQNFLDAKSGDLIIGYESNPVKQIVAMGRVSAKQDGEKIYIEKTEGLSSPIDYAALKACSELEQMEYFKNPQGSLFKLTKGEFDFIVDMIREENPVIPSNRMERYSKEEFLEEVFMTEAQYDRLTAVLRRKKNLILQGAPGVGKTFAAKRLAYSIMGEKDDDRIEMVQFHQNYSYEDFIMGYQPIENGFELKFGVFYRFCQKAANHQDKDYFFIIDEINRGNMSKIFGELLMLIENDYRGTKATLAYNGLSFSVPERLHIIGMMNTADRSLAMIDYALRRRFSFFDMEPGFDTAGFLKYQKGISNAVFPALMEKVKELNREIVQDQSLGKGFCIGHSYFCKAGEWTKEELKDIVDYDILPMLCEYWFDDSTKLKRWENILHDVFQ